MKIYIVNRWEWYARGLYNIDSVWSNEIDAKCRMEELKNSSFLEIFELNKLPDNQ